MRVVFYIIKFILLVIITAWISVVTAQTNAEIKVDLEISNKPLKEVFTALEQKSDLHFVYNDALVSNYTGISVSSKNRTVASILTEVLSKTNLRFIQQVNKIIIEKKDVLPSASPAMQNEPVRREVITGIVVEEGNNRPIRNANVYFDGTLNGTTTDSTGNFTLDLRSTSKIKISVTAVGFYPGSASEYIPGTRLIIHLKPRSYELAAVEIMADDGLSRKEKLKLFKKEFLGDDDNAWNCDILNEDDIRVTYNIKKNILKAYCDNPILIRNKNLGYLLSFTLESFLSSDDGTFFTGTQFFKEDINPMDLKKIEKARKATYLGSRMHFIRSLWNNELKKNNFRVNRALGYQMYYEDMVVEHDNQKFLNPTETLEIIYRWNKSQLFKNTLGKEIYIDKNGYNNPAGVNWAGAIGDERVGDSLPLEYGLPASSSGTISAIAASGTVGSTEPAVSFIAPIDTLRSRMPIEKLYIQFDKPYYNSGDTLRMKAYLFDAALIRGSVNSGIVYVELANDSNQVVLRRMLPMGYGLGTGSIALNKSEVPEGGYTLRAYTNLMRNFGENHVFEKQLYISSASQNILVHSTSELSKKSGKDNLQLALGFSEFNKKAIGLRDIDLRVQEGKKILFRDKVRTDVDGKMDINFTIPEKTAAKAVSIIAGDGKNMPALTIPIALNRPENTDLQFMPEGGNLVAGITSRVGFKAIGEDGNAVDVSGKIYNEKNVEVAEFKSSYKGMGSFELTPQNEAYTAKLLFNDGTTKTFTLPAVKSTGTVIKVSNSPKDEWITVTVNKSPGLSQQAKYYLIGQARGMIDYEEPVHFDGFTVSEEKIPKNLFPTGIVRFTLMSADKHALNERITFVDHHDNLNIKITPDQETHPARDSVALAIQVSDDSGNPVQGTFSMAVTDDNQVKNDSLSNNILTTILLTSGLKGTVEEPGHYFQETAQAGADLDHLLLTQGWTGYDWKDVFNPPESLAYRPEFEFKIQGKVSGLSNKAGIATVQLLSSKPSFFMADTAEADGSFGFSGFPAAENLHFFLQAKNAKKRNLDLQVDAYKPPVFKPFGERLKPWYVNSDTALIRQAVTQSAQQVELVSKGSNVLEKVTITDKKIVPGSKNLNGPGESDQTLDEKDMALMGKKTLMDVIQEKIKGFNVGVFPTTQPQRSGLVSVNSGLPKPKSDDGDITGNTAGEILVKKQSYRIGEKELHLVIDGIDIEQFYIPDVAPEKPLPKWETGDPPPGHVNTDYISLRNEASLTDRMQFVKSYLTNIKAEDIKGIEVMVNPRYNSRYKSLFSSKILANLDMITTDFAFVEVTTRSGNGAFMNKLPGLVYNPVPFTNSAAFYRPKYASKASPLADLRSTIHWEPDILTDKEGKATVSFYSADRPGTYSIIMEGSNMNGNVGRKMRTIQIK